MACPATRRWPSSQGWPGVRNRGSWQEISLDLAGLMADAGRRTLTIADCMHNHPTAYQPRSKHKRVVLLVGALILLVALATGYFFYWRYVAQQLEAGVEAWAEQQRALGNEV